MFGQLQQVIVDLAASFGLVHPNLTPCCLGRGGATWHFSTYHSYDATQAAGRWASLKPARGYIDQAMMDQAGSGLPGGGKARLRKAASCLPSLIPSPRVVD